MGTNYYHITNTWPVPAHADRRHLGVLTEGYSFSLHLYPKEGVHTLNDLICGMAEAGVIEDERGRCYSLEEFLNIVLTVNHRVPPDPVYSTYSE